MRIAVVTPAMKTGERGGAEALYTGLVGALRSAGHAADQVEVSVDESSFDAILASYLACYELDLGAYDAVVSTKAPTFMVRHPNHVSYLLHTIRVFYDMFEREFGRGNSELRAQRQLIHALDRQGLVPERVVGHFANGHTTYRRLYDADPAWRDVPFRALHHPPALEGYREPRRGEYILVPGRLHRWKRVDLVIEAFEHLHADIALKICGRGEDEAALRALAAGDRRIEFLGGVGDEQLLDLYAGALVVPFVPLREDYGLITIEAFRNKKPVLTCTDSGETVEFVRDGETGLVVEPDPRAIARALEYAVCHPEEMARLGAAGSASVAHITWEAVVDGLLSALPPSARSNGAVGSARRTAGPRSGAPERAAGRSRASGRAADERAGDGQAGDAQAGDAQAGDGRADDADRPLSVAVLDMQPIDPPTGGGRIRLLGLYHALGEAMPTTYVGSYDWPGPKYRRHRLSPSLEEIDVPLSDAHFRASAEWQRRAGGKTTIDVSFPALGSLSAKFVETARRVAAEADVVVFSHPWVYPLVKDTLRGGSQLVVYDSHNVEGVLRAQLLDDGGFGTELVKDVARVESELCHAADLVLACSHEDRLAFRDVYDVPIDKIQVVPNGTFVGQIAPVREDERAAAKDRLGLTGRPVALFIGSAYGPNAEAAKFIAGTLAPALPEVQFVIVGGAGDALDGAARSGAIPNLRLTGQVDDDARLAYLAAADLALNPMFSGSGTNIKMFDFMAAGLPTVSTPVGARGIAAGPDALRVCEPDQLVPAIRELLGDPATARELGSTARRVVEESYAWEQISADLGRLLRRARTRLGRPRPFFSVVIPSYERHARLDELFARLERQTFRDFEVIVVDQSQTEWAGATRATPLDLFYVHTDVRGAVRARNAGAAYVRGAVIAFIDDDCLPADDWLANARPYFDHPAVVGVEGLITSDRVDDVRYRPVTNKGFEGLGFMTANLFVRRDVFLAIDGFDRRFDHPHFREDTDLGWRAGEYGAIPFGRDVRVYHPAQPRDTAREGLRYRATFFEKDALLLRKHPERYRTLFLREGHYQRPHGFWEHFLRGAARYGVEVDDFYLSHLAGAIASGTVGLEAVEAAATGKGR